MRIDRILRSAEYQMHEKLQNFPIFAANYVFFPTYTIS